MQSIQSVECLSQGAKSGLINEVCKVFGGLGPLSSHDLASAEPRLGPEAMAAVTDTAPVTQLPLLTAPLNTSH